MKYNIPEGFVLDQNTGLYYSQIIAEDAEGRRSQVVTWFDAESGQYHQEIYPMDGAGRKPERRRRKPPKADTAGDIQYLKNKNFMRGLAAVLIFCMIMVVIIVLIFKFLSGDFSDSPDAGEAAPVVNETANYQEAVPEGSAAAAGESEAAMISIDNEGSSTDLRTGAEPAAQGGIQGENEDNAAESGNIPEEYVTAESGNISEEYDSAEPETAEEIYEEGYEEEYDEGQYLGTFIDADFDIVRAFAPVLVFKQDYKFEMMLNFNDTNTMYYGEYYVESNAETGETNISLHDYGTENGIPANAVVQFRNNDFDYCYFMDEGFGLMGYSGSPYGFYRDTR
ncbi:MAG: hypothetical protein K5770_10795 [Lachnospiraceae bacterium]|nr:hypothetical protein [Lachnospiraceae bacterium]